MSSECFNTWKLFLMCKLSKKGTALANAQAYNTKKQKCLISELTMSAFIFDVISCLCFYTEAELAADEDLDGGDKTGGVSDETITTILNKLKTMLDGECSC